MALCQPRPGVRCSGLIELSFDKPINKLDQLASGVTVARTRTLIFERGCKGRFTLNIVGDDVAHALQTPLYPSSRGFKKPRIYPRKNQSVSLKILKICRQPWTFLIKGAEHRKDSFVCSYCCSMSVQPLYARVSENQNYFLRSNAW